MAECLRIKRAPSGEFACSMLASRRLYPNAPNHKLGTLVDYHQLPTDGTFHRALADAEMTVHLWLKILTDIEDNYQLKNIPFSLIQDIAKTSKAKVDSFLKNWTQA